MFEVVIGVGQGEAVEGEVGSDGVDEFPAVEESVGVAAGGDDVGPEAEVCGVVLDEFFDHSSDAMVDAMEDGLGGVLADGLVGGGEIDAGEPGGFVVEGVEHEVCARGDGAPEEVALIVAAIDGDGGAGVDDDAGFPHLFKCGGDIEDAIDAGLIGVFGEDLDGEVDVFADPLCLAGGLFGDDAFEKVIERGVDGGGGNGGVVAGGDVRPGLGDLAGPVGALGVGDAGDVIEVARGEDADGEAGIADVEDEEVDVHAGIIRGEG